jgi:uncharacterized membrane protein HdeD (DUF308 family)
MNETSPKQLAREPEPHNMPQPRRAIALVGLSLGVFALAAPLLPGRLPFVALGLVILVVGLLQNFTGFALRDPGASSTWFSRGGASILTGLLLLAMPRLTFAALALLLGLSWILSGVSAMLASIGRRGQEDRFWRLIDGVVNIALGLAIAVQWPIQGVVSVALFVGLRFLWSGWSALLGRLPEGTPNGEVAGLHPDSRLGLPPHAYVAQLNEELGREAVLRRRADRSWRWVLLLTFFFIHAARMDTDWNLVGMLSPAGAVLGDVALAIVLA